MANIILFSHGQLATGLADSCKLIIGENHFKVLNILLDQNIQEIKNNLDVMIQSFDDNQPVIVVLIFLEEVQHKQLFKEFQITSCFML